MERYPAGWYPDHYAPGQYRYFDGDQWTDYVDVPDGRPGSRRKRPPTFRPSAQLVDATYRMVFADRAIVAMLFVGTVVAAAAAAVVLVPAMVWGHITPGWSGGGLRGLVVAGASLGATTFVMQLVGGAVVAAALQRAEGRSATVREALHMAWGRRRQLVAWALLSSLVGVAIRALQRFGLGGIVAAWTLDLGWAVATVFATPVIMVEGTMPVATIKRSAGLLRRHFTVTLVSNLSLALPWMVLMWTAMAVGVGGALVWAFGGSVTTTIIGAVTCAIGAVGFLFVAMVSSALTYYLDTFLFRHATGLPVPGVDRRWLPPVRPS